MASDEQGWRSVNFEVFDSDWQGEGYLTVSGQVCNSVRVPNHSWMQLNLEMIGIFIGVLNWQQLKKKISQP